LSLFGGAALGLALAGVYGSLSQNLRQRQREVAIRLALGARARDMVAMLAAQGFSPVLAGVGLGVVATLAGGPFLERTNLLSATTPLDLATLTVTPALVALVSAAMATLVAQRAARVQPLQALRGD
jgi:putative ABC transport system permease protein